MSVPLDGELEDTGSGSPAYPGLPKSTIVVAAFAIAMAGLMTFVLLKWSDARSHAAALSEQIAAVDAEIAALRPELGAVEGQLAGLEQRTELLARGRLAVCNYSGEPVTVKSVSATWFGDQDRFETFNSSDHGLDLWKIPAGERVVLERPQSGWDGSATYYSLWLRVHGQEYPFAGTWPPESGDCVLWN